MFVPDRSPYLFDLSRPLLGVETIGWLDPACPFERGVTKEGFLDKLLALIRREEVGKMRGIHECPWCGKEIWIDSEEPHLLLGHAEVWVPDPTREVIFAAPNLVYHFCSVHGYRPPDSFVEAVLAFDLQSSWSGCAERRKKFEVTFKDF